MIPLKSDADLRMLRASGALLGRVLRRLRERIKVGVTTAAIDTLAATLIKSEGATPAFKGYRGYPAHICTSINEEIVHGIPSDRTLEEGDLLTLDVGVKLNGYYADCATTIAVGRVDARKKKLLEVTRHALVEGIKKARIDNYLGDISHAVQEYVERHGFSVVRDFVGHGIGSALHEEPEVPNFGQSGTGPVLKSGMVLAIEPMVNAGSWRSRITENGWTAVTVDGEPSAHFEHTVAITNSGPEILTQ